MADRNALPAAIETRAPGRALTVLGMMGLIALALGGCGRGGPARVHVVIDADSDVRARTEEIRVRVLGAGRSDAGAVGATDSLTTRRADEVGWPADATIVPRHGDTGRSVHVEVSAVDGSGTVIARAAASTTFPAAGAREVRFLLDASCAQRVCEAIDGGASDGGSGEVDAGVRGTLDAGVAPRPDAAPPECGSGSSRACGGGSDVGACAVGTQACAGGRWGACGGRVDAVPETCNAIDDDCDGAVDEHVTRPCGRRGRCSQACDDGEWRRCERHDDRCDDDDDDD